MNTYVAKASTINPSWHLIDASDLVVGRLASRISMLLRGKHLPTFTSHVNPQVKIVVVNADKIKFTGNKMDMRKGKVYYRHTGYPGGIKEQTAGKMLAGAHPERVLKLAVLRMLKHNNLRNDLIGNLYIYAGPEHTHAGQQPKPYDFGAQNRKNIAPKNS